MLYIKVSLITVFAIAAVHAARYCECENRDDSVIFPGIQQVCSQLSNSWCSTNCNIFGKNCDYCQYTPAGDFPDADYAALKNWCFKQSVYSTFKQRFYLGSEVNCYSYCVYNYITTLTPFPLSRVALPLPIAPATDPCQNTRNLTNQVAAHRSARANQTPAC